MSIQNSRVQIEFENEAECLWSYHSRDVHCRIPIAPPHLEVDGKGLSATLDSIRPVVPPKRLVNRCTEYRFEGAVTGNPHLAMELVFRLAEDSAVVRFHYILKSRAAHALTKREGDDTLTYLRTPLAEWSRIVEVRLSGFSDLAHSYCPSEHTVEARQFEDGCRLMGPILVAGDGLRTVLLAYEHGSQAPHAFLQFSLTPKREVALVAVRGNHCDGEPLDEAHSWSTVWFQVAGTRGGVDEMAREYRAFVLRHQSPNQESRKPYIFYNTWAFQERNKWLNSRAYLDSMHQERILQEIDVANRMGIDVFVLDTGWYEKTGDWAVNRKRFPDGLKAVRERLAGHGMKLGLWFSPTHAAVSSRLLQTHRDCIMSSKGKQHPPYPVWETEESQSMCLVSRCADAFADELVRLVKEVGVTYFKWDAIQQYGCDSPDHSHGNARNSEQERADSYAFQLPQAMGRIVDRLCDACPEAIVDFDVTEGGRCVGLGFLASGKYFLINNGPYYGNYNIPIPETQWSNIFVHPGPARGWICRTPLAFDRWIPSVLFLTHYLPDDPEDSQLVNIGSLILGQNGIWGDLLTVSEAGVKRFGKILGLYKQVRDDITSSTPVRDGAVGSSPEIHEKVFTKTGRGVVVIFATQAGTYSYVTAHRVAKGWWMTGHTKVEADCFGRARIEVEFDAPGARIVFFGVGA